MPSEIELKKEINRLRLQAEIFGYWAIAATSLLICVLLGGQ